MSTVLFYLFLAAFFVVCLMLITVILAQEGKGGGLSGLAGTAAIGETFGFSGAAEGFRRWTRNVAIVFFIMCVILTFWGEKFSGGSLAEKFVEGATAGGALAPVEPTPAPEAAPTATEQASTATDSAAPSEAAPAPTPAVDAAAPAAASPTTADAQPADAATTTP